MMNQVFLIGRLKELNSNEDHSILQLEVPRNFKNEDGLYDKDILPVKLYGNISESIKEYCTIGDVVGIKARLQMDKENIELIADKVTFLSGGKND